MNALKITLLLLLSHTLIISQSNNFNSYLPLQLGNKWFYNCSSSDPYNYSQDKVRIEIVDSNSYYGKKYFICFRTVYHITGNGSLVSGMFLFGSAYSIIRLDSVNGNIYYYSSMPNQWCNYSLHDVLTDSLNAKLNDTVKIVCRADPYFYKCTDTSSQKNFYNEYQNVTRHRRYGRGIGLTYSFFKYIGGGISSNSQTLSGRVINGIAYGDTSFTFTGVNPISTEIPNAHSLSQNYPNPFNPATKIRFDIPHVGNGRERSVKLVIYDLLGREAAVLVNEELKPGVYEVNFDGANQPSGVYYYKLISGSFTQAKKMVLLK